MRLSQVSNAVASNSSVGFSNFAFLSDLVRIADNATDSNAFLSDLYSKLKAASPMVTGSVLGTNIS